MHKKSIINVIGLILVFVGFSMQFSVIVAGIYGEGDLIPILIPDLIVNKGNNTLCTQDFDRLCSKSTELFKINR